MILVDPEDRPPLDVDPPDRLFMNLELLLFDPPRYWIDGELENWGIGELGIWGKGERGIWRIGEREKGRIGERYRSDNPNPCRDAIYRVLRFII